MNHIPAFVAAAAYADADTTNETCPQGCGTQKVLAVRTTNGLTFIDLACGHLEVK